MTAPGKDDRLAEAVRLREQGQNESAREQLLVLAAEFPDDRAVAYQTAWVHDRLGLEAEAVPFYERSLAGPGLSDEERRGALLGLGSTYRTLGHTAQAVTTLRRGTVEFAGDGAMKAFLAMALYNTGQHHEAMRILLDLLADTSRDPEVQAYRTAIALYAEDLDKVR